MKKPQILLSFLSLFLVYTPADLNAQLLGGQRNFAFLELPVSARLSALTESIAVLDGDNSLAYRNPAVLNPESNGNIHVSTLFHFEDIQSAYMSYSHALKKLPSLTWHAGFNHVGYGEFTRRDVTGQNQGDFQASDLAIHIGTSYKLYDRMQIGGNIKYITSNYDNFVASAMAFDLGTVYHIDEKRMALALTVNNFGFMLDEFTENSRSLLPVNVQLALTKQFEHLPFRYSIIYQYLNAWDLEYSEESGEPTDGFFTDDSASESNFGTNLLKHFIVNAELLLGPKEGFVVRASYDFLRRRELKLNSIGGGMGISFGVGLRISKFRLDYGRSIYHQAGANNHLSFSTNINSFTSKSKFE